MNFQLSRLKREITDQSGTFGQSFTVKNLSNFVFLFFFFQDVDLDLGEKDLIIKERKTKEVRTVIS